MAVLCYALALNPYLSLMETLPSMIISKALWMIPSIIASEMGASPEGLIRSYQPFGAYCAHRIKEPR